MKTGFSLFFLGLGLVTLLAYVQLGIAHADRAGRALRSGRDAGRSGIRRAGGGQPLGALNMRIVYTDVLVVGGGLAGLRAAVGARRRGPRGDHLSLVPPKRSHSAAAQGGMQASLGNTTTGRRRQRGRPFEDTVRGSDWGCDQEVARLFAHTAPQAVRELAAWGVPWNRSRPASARW